MNEPPVHPSEWVLFRVGHQHCGVALDRVVRVVRMVRLTPLSHAPDVILGVFDFHGEIVPVASTRRRFREPDRAPSPQDQLLIVRTPQRQIALAVDAVDGVATIDPVAVTLSQHVAPGLDYLRGVTRLLEHGLVLLHDVDAFLSLAEDAQIAAALAAAP